MTSRFVSLAVAVAVVSCLQLAPAAVAQVPDEFSNLQLLDPAISKEQLVGTMRDWARGIGQRCNYCHVGPDDLEGMDFASDEKDTKRTARKMLELSRVLNRELLRDLPTAEGRRAMVVSCYVCHQGEARPPRNVPPQ
jgi:mono/diheme cytochrome c family protein